MGTVEARSIPPKKGQTEDHGRAVEAGLNVHFHEERHTRGCRLLIEFNRCMLPWHLEYGEIETSSKSALLSAILRLFILHFSDIELGWQVEIVPARTEANVGETIHITTIWVDGSNL